MPILNHKQQALLELTQLANMLESRLTDIMQGYYINIEPRDIIFRNVTSIKKHIKKL